MATRLTPLGILLKWFVAPISLGAIGYFLVGPRVESQVPDNLKEKVLQVTGNGKPETTASNDKPSEEVKPNHSFTEPEVDVSVTALNTPRPKRPKKKRRRRKPPVETTAPSAPVQEPPPSGGAAEPPPTGDGV